jgi:WhiB family redox-sensing transcriptional regulator
VSDWSDQAQCREAGVEMFFPWKGSGQPVYAHHVADAVAVCAECPVRAECADEARRSHESGVWGGILFSHGHVVNLGDGSRTRTGRPSNYGVAQPAKAARIVPTYTPTRGAT